MAARRRLGGPAPPPRATSPVPPAPSPLTSTQPRRITAVDPAAAEKWALQSFASHLVTITTRVPSGSPQESCWLVPRDAAYRPDGLAAGLRPGCRAGPLVPLALQARPRVLSHAFEISAFSVEDSGFVESFRDSSPYNFPRSEKFPRSFPSRVHQGSPGSHGSRWHHRTAPHDGGSKPAGRRTGTNRALAGAVPPIMAQTPESGW